MPGNRLKEKGRIFREGFLAKLALLLRGTVSAPPERFGETLADEHIRGGMLFCTPNDLERHDTLKRIIVQLQSL